MPQDKKFIDGLFVEKKETQYGEILKLSFKVEKFKQFLNENQNENGYVNVDILTNKDGKKYAVLNEYKKPEAQQEQRSEQPNDFFYIEQDRKF